MASRGGLRRVWPPEVGSLGNITTEAATMVEEETSKEASIVLVNVGMNNIRETYKHSTQISHKSHKSHT